MRQDARVTDDEMRACRGCAARFPRTPWALDQDLRASPECWRAYGEAAMFAAGHQTVTGQVLQLTVDTYGAQHAGEPTPVIRVAYGLAGLYLALERGRDGLAVRAAHQRMGKPQDWWPTFDAVPPGPVTVADVLTAGARADSPTGHVDAVRRWADAVWQAWAPRHADVAAFVERALPGA
jgi:Family of unknown function (DUF5946)